MTEIKSSYHPKKKNSHYPYVLCTLPQLHPTLLLTKFTLHFFFLVQNSKHLSLLFWTQITCFFGGLILILILHAVKKMLIFIQNNFGTYYQTQTYLLKPFSKKIKKKNLSTKATVTAINIEIKRISLLIFFSTIHFIKEKVHSKKIKNKIKMVIPHRKKKKKKKFYSH